MVAQMIERSSPRTRRSLAPLVFFLPMAVVVIANAALIWFAVSTWQGLVTEKPYEKGLAYNRAIAELDAAERLGWGAEIGFLAAGDDGAGEIRARLLDRDGRPLSGLAVSVSVGRPVENIRLDGIALAYRGEGLYAAKVLLPKRGQWDLSLVAMRGEDRYVARRRLVLP